MRSERYSCSICGASVLKAHDLKHRCPERTLSAIDAANSRAWNEEITPPDERVASDTNQFWRTFAYRLHEGARLMRDEDP